MSAAIYCLRACVGVFVHDSGSLPISSASGAKVKAFPFLHNPPLPSPILSIHPSMKHPVVVPACKSTKQTTITRSLTPITRAFLPGSARSCQGEYLPLSGELTVLGLPQATPPPRPICVPSTQSVKANPNNHTVYSFSHERCSSCWNVAVCFSAFHVTQT